MNFFASRIALKFIPLTACNYPTITNAETSGTPMFVEVGQGATIQCEDGYTIDGKSSTATTVYCKSGGLYARQVQGPAQTLPECLRGTTGVWFSSKQRMVL